MSYSSNNDGCFVWILIVAIMTMFATVVIAAPVPPPKERKPAVPRYALMMDGGLNWAYLIEFRPDGEFLYKRLDETFYRYAGTWKLSGKTLTLRERSLNWVEIEPDKEIVYTYWTTHYFWNKGQWRCGANPAFKDYVPDKSTPKDNKLDWGLLPTEGE